MSGTDPGTERRHRRIANDFKRDELLDRLLAWRDADSPRWNDVGRSMQLRA